MTLLDHSRAQERDAAKTRPTTVSDTVVGSMAADGAHENTREGSPVEKQRLGSYQSAVSLRLQRMYRATTSDETLEAAEDKFDEAAEMVVANTPSEIRQLSSCTLRMIFRVVLYGSYLVAVAFFFSTVYKAKLRATYLAADRDSGDCDSVWTTFTGTHKLDVGGRWDTDPDYEPQRSLFIVDFAKLPANDYQKAMTAVAEELRAIVRGDPRSLLESLLLATTRNIRVLDGGVSVSFNVRAESYMDLPTGTAGFAGCPSPYGGDFEHDLANPAFQYDMRIENGALVFSLDTVETLKTCQKTRSGKSLGDVLRAPNHDNIWGKRNLELSVHLHSLAAATAINYGLVEPLAFMQPLDASTFNSCYDDDYDDDDDDDLQDEIDYAQYMQDNFDDDGWNNDDLQEYVEGNCEAYPNTSTVCGDNGMYFQDKRFPGMDPIVCVNDADAKPVCSVLAGSIPVYPAFRFFDDQCNTCKHVAQVYDLDDDEYSGPLGQNLLIEYCRGSFEWEGLDFLGGLMVGWKEGGIFHEQPNLVQERDVPHSRQWGDIESLGYHLVIEDDDDDDDDDDDFNDPGSDKSLLCPLYERSSLLAAFNIFNDDRGEVKLNADQYMMDPQEWVCNTTWVHDDVFDKLAVDVASAPVPPQFDYYKCTPSPDEAREEAIGIAMGNGALVFLVVAFLLVHVLVRMLDKLGQIHFRNGRFIAPAALDEWTEHQAVNAILRDMEAREQQQKLLQA